MTAPSNANTSGLYLLMKRGLFYRPDAMGYTGIKDQAGRYSEAEAKKHADFASGVIMVGEDEAPDFTPNCHDDLARAHLQTKLDAALVTAASAQARTCEFETLLEHAGRYQAEFRDRANAAEARADRLADRLRADPTPDQLEPFARKWCIDNGIDPDEPKAPHGEWPEWYDACGPFAAMWRDLATHALQQEG